MGYGDYMPGFNPSMQVGMQGMNMAPQAAARGAQQPMGNPGALYSQPNMQGFSNAANVFLQNYGMQEPTPDQINPYLFFGNSGAMANHPGIASALDNGLSGLAFTQGSRTWGEGMSNVAQGIMQARGAHIQNVANQYMRPLAMAEQLQDIQGRQSKIDLESAQAGYYRDKIEATRPVIDPWSGRVSTYDKSQGKWVTTDPPAGTVTHGSAYIYGADQRKSASDYAADKRAEAKAAGITKTERTAKLLEADDVEHGGEPWSPGKQARVIQQIDANSAAAAAGGRKSAGQALGDVPEDVKLDFDVDKQKTLHGLLKPGDIMDQFTAEQAGFKSVDEYNNNQLSGLKSRHPEAFPKPAGSSSKPKAVSPKSGARPPLSNFEGK